MTTATSSRLLSPKDVCEMVPGLTVKNLAQMRYLRRGPKFYKPTPRLVTYREDDVLAWIEASAQDTTP